MDKLKDFLRQSVKIFEQGTKNSLINRYEIDTFQLEYRKLGNSNFYYFYESGNKFLTMQATKKEILANIHNEQLVDLFIKYLEVNQLSNSLCINNTSKLDTKRLKI
jgi:hypothetical protein